MRIKISVLGLGYVGLPLSVMFSKKYEVIGYDINPEKIKSLSAGIDTTGEVEEQLLKEAYKLSFTNNIEEIKGANVYVVAVPTPVDKFNRPNLTPLIHVTRSIIPVLKKGDYVVFESTVFPGATEEICVPILEESGLQYNSDFFVGYSPERINPGDKVRTIYNTIKITSGSTRESANFIDKLYASVLEAETYKVDNIKIAEAAKVIENTQRDLNIAFVNELSQIFSLLDIDTNKVLEAAGTKWNFLKFTPGLVGGHCIGVDPYYLVKKAQDHGYTPELILSSRKINEGMGAYVVNKCIKLLIKNGLEITTSHALILGVTFKENCNDLRNSKVFDVIKELEEFGVNVNLYDPMIEKDDLPSPYQNLYVSKPRLASYQLIIYAVPHKAFSNMQIRPLLVKKGILFDIKGKCKETVEGRL